MHLLTEQERAMEDQRTFKLNLGCGADYLQGYVNIDMSDRYHCDVYGDIGSPDTLARFKGRCTEVLASHVLEHFESKDNERLLSLWWSMLVVGGVLKLVVPDFKWVAEQWVSLEDWELDNRMWQDQVFGLVASGDTELERHRQAFFPARLERIILESVPGNYVRAWEYGFDHAQQTIIMEVQKLA